MRFDPRLTPARPDLAASHLQAHIKADHYAIGRTEVVRAAVVNLHHAPVPDAPLDTQALFGEEIIIYEEREGWVWGQLKNDHYVGYLPHIALGETGLSPTHRIAVPASFLYPAPNIKMPALMSLPMGALVHCVEYKDRFARLDYLGWVWRDHLQPHAIHAEDFVSMAEMFEHAPYLWGGRTHAGLDCSALVQIALAQAGVQAPRDTDMQEAGLGSPLPPAAWDRLRRGDLVFWSGHVGIMQDGQRLLHANGHHMRVVSEPLAQARHRIEAQTGRDISSIRRLETEPS
jgi:cell wall-associated NlpC family hydrolase